MAQHAESEDDVLQSLSKDGKLSMKKVDMLAQMATWGVTNARDCKSVEGRRGQGRNSKDIGPTCFLSRARRLCL